MRNSAEALSTEEQIDKMKQDSDFGTEEIRDIQNARSQITQEIELSTELGLNQKKTLIQRLNKEVSSTDVAEVLEFRKTINKEISSYLDETYEKRITENREAFALDTERGVDTADEFITEFKTLSLDKKREWFSKLDQEIAKRVTLREKLRTMMPELDEAQLRKMRRHDMQDLINNATETDTFLSKNEKYYSDDEVTELKEKMGDCTKSEQMELIKEAKDSLEKRKELHEIFTNLPKEFNKAAGNFPQQTLAEKERSIDRVQEEMKAAYKFKFAKACEAGYVCQRSADEAYDYFKTAEMTGKFGMIEAWKNLDKQLEDEHKFQIKFQKTMKELAPLLTKEEAAELEHKFAMSTYYEKEQQLLPDVEKLLAEKQKESKEEEARTKEYKDKLTEARNSGYISEGTMKLSLKLWKDGDKTYKDKTFDTSNPEIFEDKLKPYVDAFNDFHQASAQIKNGKMMSETRLSEKNVEFRQGGLKTRTKLVMELQDVISKNDNTSETQSEQPAEQENLQETNEQTQKINQLSMQAMQAERQKDFQKAYDCYLQILDLDPNDQIAKRNADHVKSMLEENTEPQDTSAQQQKAEELIKEVSKNGDIHSEMEEQTILETFAEETAGSENVEKSTKAANRGNRSGELERDISDKLGDDYQLQEDGTAEEVIFINQGTELTGNTKEQLKRTAREDIIKSSDKKHMSNIQFRSRDGRNIGAQEAQAAIDKKDAELKNQIRAKALAKGKASETLEKELDQQLDDQELRVDIAA